LAPASRRGALDLDDVRVCSQQLADCLRAVLSNGLVDRRVVRVAPLRADGAETRGNDNGSGLLRQLQRRAALGVLRIDVRLEADEHTGYPAAVVLGSQMQRSAALPIGRVDVAAVLGEQLYRRPVVPCYGQVHGRPPVAIPGLDEVGVLLEQPLDLVGMACFGRFVDLAGPQRATAHQGDQRDGNGPEDMNVPRAAWKDGLPAHSLTSLSINTPQPCLWSRVAGLHRARAWPHRGEAGAGGVGTTSSPARP